MAGSNGGGDGERGEVGRGLGFSDQINSTEKENSGDHDHMCTKFFLRESWSWSSFFSSSGPDFQRTMTMCVARVLKGKLGHGHRLFFPINTSLLRGGSF